MVKKFYFNSKFKIHNNMMKKYIVPVLREESADVISMLAESLVINNDTTVDGGDALTKKAEWDIWSDESTPEE
jgi:hypothetical protein